MNRLHPGALWNFRFRGYVVTAFAALFIFNFFLPLKTLAAYVFSTAAAQTFLAFVIGALFVLVIGEVYARLAYSNWAYEFTKDALKTEQGIIWKKYSSVPYERVQNVDIRRGIVARMFGFSSLALQTAGYSGKQQQAEGYLPAVDMKEAEKLRDFVMAKAGKGRQGL